MTATDVASAADALDAARRSGVWLDALPERLAPASVAEAYLVQDDVTRRSGRVTAGWKIGATSIATQTLLGTDEPIVGRMFADAIAPSPAVVRGQRADVLIVEAEFAFVMAQTLLARPQPYAAAEVIAAVGTLVPALEYIGSVFTLAAGRPITDILVDNAGHGGLVLGVATAGWTPDELPEHAVRLEQGGRTIASGAGSAVLGNPIVCLTWLANALSRRGVDLCAGEIVTTGTCTGAQTVAAGVDVRGDFGRFGTVDLRFDDVVPARSSD